MKITKGGWLKRQYTREGIMHGEGGIMLTIAGAMMLGIGVLVIFMVNGVVGPQLYEKSMEFAPAGSTEVSELTEYNCTINDWRNVTYLPTAEDCDCGCEDTDFRLNITEVNYTSQAYNCTVLDWRNATWEEAEEEPCDCGCEDSEVKLNITVANCTEYGEGVGDWLAGYDYRKEIIISSSAGAGTDYQIELEIGSSSGGDLNLSGNALSYPNDIRFTDDDKVTELDYYISNFSLDPVVCWVKIADNLTSSNASIYCYYGKENDSSGSNGSDTFIFFDDMQQEDHPDFYTFSVLEEDHDNYGLSYPITYEFSLPVNSSNLTAYKKYNITDNWTNVTERTRTEFFNGIEAARFDYTNDSAFVSVELDSDSDVLYLKVVNESGGSVGTYVGITPYYDNRTCVVTASADEFNNGSAPYNCSDPNGTFASTYYAGALLACDLFTSRQLWLSIGIVTYGELGTGAPNWTEIQEKVDAGYIEPVSHSRIHTSTPYGDYDSEINGSKQDIITNLTLPAQNTKGSTEYVYYFIEPGGGSDATARSKLGDYHYLADRSVVDDGTTFATWDSTNELYNRFGSYWVGDDVPHNDTPTLNAKFDAVYAAGGIYHISIHTYDGPPAGCRYGVNLTEGGYFADHLDYIKNKTDVWYVGVGQLYLYHFIEDRNIILADNEWAEVTATGWDADIVDNELKITSTSTTSGDPFVRSIDLPSDILTLETEAKVVNNSLRTIFEFGRGNFLEWFDHGERIEFWCDNGSWGVREGNAAGGGHTDRVVTIDSAFPTIANLTWYNLKLVAGTEIGDPIRIKVWEAGTAEPGTWNVEDTNNYSHTTNILLSAKTDGAAQQDTRYDNVRVRKYAETEPTLINVGIEEDEGEMECLEWDNISYGTICFDDYHTPAPEDPNQIAWFTSECNDYYNESSVICFNDWYTPPPEAENQTAWFSSDCWNNYTTHGGIAQEMREDAASDMRMMGDTIGLVFFFAGMILILEEFGGIFAVLRGHRGKI
jgi:hypothetical protein